MSSARPTREVRPDRRQQIVAAGERFLAEHGIPFEQVEFVAYEEGRFDGLCYVHFAQPDPTGAIARVLHVKLPPSPRHARAAA